MRRTFKRIKKAFIAVVGITILAIGILMILSPGPAIIVIPIGLSILASEFIWAEKMLSKFKSKFAWFRNKEPEVSSD